MPTRSCSSTLSSLSSSSSRQSMWRRASTGSRSSPARLLCVCVCVCVCASRHHLSHTLPPSTPRSSPAPRRAPPLMIAAPDAGRLQGQLRVSCPRRKQGKWHPRHPRRGVHRAGRIRRRLLLQGPRPLSKCRTRFAPVACVYVGLEVQLVRFRLACLVLFFECLCSESWSKPAALTHARHPVVWRL